MRKLGTVISFLPKNRSGSGEVDPAGAFPYIALIIRCCGLAVLGGRFLKLTDIARCLKELVCSVQSTVQHGPEVLSCPSFSSKRKGSSPAHTRNRILGDPRIVAPSAYAL